MESLVKKGTVGEVLFRSRIITEDDIRLALEEQRLSGCRFGEALVKLGIVDQEDIDWALSNQLDIPYVRLNEQTIDRNAVKLVPRGVARKYNLIPIIRTEDELHIALADPLDRTAVEEVEKLTGCRVTVSMPVIRELTEMLDLFYGPARDDASFGFSSSSFSESILEKINSDSSGTRMLEHLIVFFLQNGIESISLQPAAADVQVSVRSNRLFREIGRFPLNSYPDLLSYILKLTRFDNSGDLVKEGKVVFRFRECDVVLRVSMIKAQDGDCVTIRLWSKHTFPSRLDDLGLGMATASRFRSLTEIDSGLVLFSSWNRYERSRLLDLYLVEAATTGKNVMLLGENIGRGKKSFPRIPLADGHSEGLEWLMTVLDDHDPDILMLEDITDSRSFLTAWKSAMRNRIVVAGISCSGLGGALDYLLSERHFNHSIMAGIRGIVSCSGIRTLCPHCRESHPDAGRDMELPHTDLYHRGKGCADCGFSGLNGMKYLLEVVTVDAAFRDSFESARESAELLSRISGNGYGNIDGQLQGLLCKGDISPEEYAAARVQY
jgi:type II secretory ATPase GspE/PulE/Tfp pilus assembly ATPase PilB-like protein